jgi:hypothetical protein
LKLRPLNYASSTAINIAKASRRFHIPVLADRPAEQAVIVLADGTPDDIIISIVAHYSDEDRVLWIDKPQKKGLAALDAVQTLYKFSNPVRVFLLIVDQEDLPLNQIKPRISSELANRGIIFELIFESERLYVLGCNRHLPHSFSLIILLNGTDQIISSRHTIEDHLILFPDEYRENTSKEFWNNLTKDRQAEILQRIATSETLARQILPQQFASFERLIEMLI